MASILAGFCSHTYCFIRYLFSISVSIGPNLGLRYHFYTTESRCCLVFDNSNYSNDFAGIVGMEMCVQHSQRPVGILVSICCYKLSHMVWPKGNNRVAYFNKTYASLTCLKLDGNSNN